MPTEHRGFASMDRERQREIAGKGGCLTHLKGTAHQWTTEEALEAGRKGGLVQYPKRSEYLGIEIQEPSLTTESQGDIIRSSGRLHEASAASS